MKIDFEKYHGTGNDFVLIDNRTGYFPQKDLLLIQSICHRHFGVGSDGLMLIQSTPEADFEMIFYNPDGSRSLCGNGSRCAVHYAAKLGLAKGEGIMLTTDGLHLYRNLPTSNIAIQMHPVSAIISKLGFSYLHTGSPHLIVPVDDIEEVDVLSQGSHLRYHSEFTDAGGTNVNFVAPIKNGAFAVRTYERGVEDETLSCGTGVTAVALAMANQTKINQSVVLETRGGTLQVSFRFVKGQFEDIWLEGPAKHIFTGSYAS